MKTAALLTEKSSWGRGTAGGGAAGGHSVRGCGCSPGGRSGSGGPRGGRGQGSSDALRMKEETRECFHESVTFLVHLRCRTSRFFRLMLFSFSRNEAQTTNLVRKPRGQQPLSPAESSYVYAALSNDESM